MGAIILVGLKASIVLLVFALGLGANTEEKWYLLRRPGLVARSLFAQDIAMPLVAAAVALVFELEPALAIALITLAISPVPATLPKRLIKAGATADYVFGLLVTAALFSIVFVPAAILVLGGAFGVAVYIPARAIAAVVLATLLLPLAAGLAVRRLAPPFARRMERPFSAVATVLLLASLLPVLITAWPAMVALCHSGALVAITSYSVLGHTVGHWLGGPEHRNRVVLAVSTASRHPAVAIAIAQIGFPHRNTAVVGILLVLLVNTVVSAIYLAWQRRRAAKRPSSIRTADWCPPAPPKEEEPPVTEARRTGDRADRTPGPAEPRRGA
jgi:BASS family bile acid:Na+ symporter